MCGNRLGLAVISRKLTLREWTGEWLGKVALSRAEKISAAFPILTTTSDTNATVSVTQLYSIPLYAPLKRFQLPSAQNELIRASLLQGTKRTPYITNKEAPQEGSRGEHKY